MSDTIATSSDSGVARSAVLHSKWRWAGAPLLASGAVLALWALGAFLTGGSGLTLGLSLLGTGMGLASFGANHDAAMALALRARDQGQTLPPSLRHELAEELERDRSGVMAMKAAPRIALVLPLVAVLVQAGVAYRLVG